MAVQPVLTNSAVKRERDEGGRKEPKEGGRLDHFLLRQLRPSRSHHRLRSTRHVATTQLIQELEGSTPNASASFRWRLRLGESIRIEVPELPEL